MELEKLFNEKRIIQVNNLLGDLDRDWKPITYTSLRNTYFNKSKSFTVDCINLLEKNGLIDVDRPEDRSYVNGRWIPNSNRYRLKSTPDTYTKTISYRGIEPKELITFTIKDKEIVKEIWADLDPRTEQEFIKQCINKGFTKTKGWYFYNKLNN